ncbi:hypothetical protein [Nocardia terpenica]|uniref:hypothetical protein n=1 Tax=Nocardia terpenica TaxID=455432 RepID=UPI000AD278AE|nr:hypothetical protein [Nocardia terpenica]NQE89384.1 hypothetical protein [Nocardia terpenica]
MDAAWWMRGDGWFGRVLQTAPTCVVVVALLLVLAMLCFGDSADRWLQRLNSCCRWA